MRVARGQRRGGRRVDCPIDSLCNLVLDGTRRDCGWEAEMSVAADDSIKVSYAMSVDDYRRYFALVNRQRQPRQATFIFLAVFFGAIPVALAFRFIATNPSRHAGD